MNNKNEEARASESSAMAKKRSIGLLILLPVLALSLVAAVLIRHSSQEEKPELNNNSATAELVVEKVNASGESDSSEDESETRGLSYDIPDGTDTPLISVEIDKDNVD
ncbi:MAG: hypothetical protein E7612_09255 [Ruminococcaceae bacterium]|nr:hypothetical protein [Oscillospiraceae bacterium]